MDDRCDLQKRGRFDRLRCVLPEGHAGEHNFVVMGVLPAPGRNERRCSDAEHERRRQRDEKRKRRLSEATAGAKEVPDAR